jgi:DNA-binding Xre family transcriptional regulator
VARIVWDVRELAEQRGYKDAKSLGFACGIFPASMKPIWDGSARQIALRTMEKICGVLKVEPGNLFHMDAKLEPLPEDPRKPYERKPTKKGGKKAPAGGPAIRVGRPPQPVNTTPLKPSS